MVPEFAVKDLPLGRTLMMMMRVLEHAKFIIAYLLCMANIMSLTSVLEWQKRSRDGRTSLQDDSCSGQAHRAIVPDVIAQIDGLIWKNRQITEKQIRVQVSISHDSMHAIIKHHLQFRKI